MGRLSAGLRQPPRKPVSPHTLGLVAVLMSLAWTFRGTPVPGLTIHWLVAPLAYHVLGLRWALVAALGAAAFTVATGTIVWADAPREFALAGLLPALIACGWLHLVERRLARHLFIYLLVGVFAGALLAVFGAGVASLLWSPPTTPWPSDHWIALLILAHGEAITTGFLVSGLAIYRPERLYTFDADVYIGRPGTRG